MTDNILKLGDKLYIKTGLVKFKEGDYLTALKLFSRCTSYEGWLNRLLCLFKRRDFGYVNELYFQFRARFSENYNCFSDLADQIRSDPDEEILEYLESRKQRRSKNKLSADTSLLVDIKTDGEDWSNFADDDGLFDFLREDGFESSLEYENTHVFDLRSDEYSEHLCKDAEYALFKGDHKGAEKLYDRILEVNPDYLPALEVKLCMDVGSGNIDKAAETARKIYNKELTPSGLFYAMSAFAKAGCEPERLAYVICELLKYAPDLDNFMLEDCVEYATNIAKDYRAAFIFAKELYSDAENLGLDAFKICVAAFYNYGRVSLAEEAASSLIAAMPEDPYAAELMAYIKHYPDTLSVRKLNIKTMLDRHFELPDAVRHFAIGNVEAALYCDVNYFDENILRDLSAIVYCLRNKVLNDSDKNRDNMLSLFQSAIKNIFPKEGEKKVFFAFAKHELASILAISEVNALIVEKLDEMNFNGKVSVNLGNGQHLLDFRIFSKCGTDNFKKVLYKLSVLLKVDENFLSTAQSLYEGAENFAMHNGIKPSANEFAFFIIKTLFANFDTDDDFSEEDKRLYETILDAAKESEKENNKSSNM